MRQTFGQDELCATFTFSAQSGSVGQVDPIVLTPTQKEISMNRLALVSIAILLLSGFAQAEQVRLPVGKMTKEQLKEDCAQYGGTFTDGGWDYYCKYPGGGSVVCVASTNECTVILRPGTPPKTLQHHLSLNQLHKQLNE